MESLENAAAGTSLKQKTDLTGEPQIPDKDPDEGHLGDNIGQISEVKATILEEREQVEQTTSSEVSVPEKTIDDYPAIKGNEIDNALKITESSVSEVTVNSKRQSESVQPQCSNATLSQVIPADNQFKESQKVVLNEFASKELEGKGEDTNHQTEDNESLCNPEIEDDDVKYEAIGTTLDIQEVKKATDISVNLNHQDDIHVADERPISSVSVSDKIEEETKGILSPSTTEVVDEELNKDDGKVETKEVAVTKDNVIKMSNESEVALEEMEFSLEKVSEKSACILDNIENATTKCLSPSVGEMMDEELTKEGGSAETQDVLTKDDLMKISNEAEQAVEEMETSLEEILEESESNDQEKEINEECRVPCGDNSLLDKEVAQSLNVDVDKSPGETYVAATNEAYADRDMEIGSSNELTVEDVTGHDATSKSPISDVGGDSKITNKTGLGEKRGKTSSKGFSLGNIVSRLKFQVESKQEEADVGELKRETVDAIPEKTQSKRSEQKQQGKQMRAAAHAAMMMYQDNDFEEDGGEDEAASRNESTQLAQGNQSKDMTKYANNTMDELLGMYGFDKLDGHESNNLQLSSSLTQSKIPITGSVTTLKQNQKPDQAQKPSQGETGLIISNVTSMASAQKVADDILQEATKKTNYCAECSLAVDDAILLVASDHIFCSQACLDNYQGRQTLVCDYCSGMITQAATKKFVRETQEGRKKFCSQPCSEEFSKRVRNCNTCGKEISKASEGILAPVGSGGKFVDFCKQECVDNYGKKPPAAKQETGKMEGSQPRYWAQDTFFVCAVCNNYAKAKHVISLQGKLNGLCSTDCFTQFKEKNQLAFSLCSQCSALCTNQKMMRSIEIEGKVHRFCSMRCFKMKLKRSMSTIACAACKKPNWAQSMIEEWNGTELVRFFCSTTCLDKRDTIPFTSIAQKVVSTTKTLIPPVGKTQPSLPKQQKPQQVQQVQQTSQSNSTRPASGGGNKCDHCSKQQRPQYHLTMSDNSIRNFCTYGCVIAFQAQFNVPPVTLPQETLQLTCSQCHRGFSNKPLPLDFKSVVNVFCTQNCLDEFKRVNSVVVECDYCHLEKILHERIYFSGQARSFCSEGCKLLFKQQFAQRLGLRCTVCDYCAQTCRSRVERMYGNHKKKFCSMACRAQYDSWLSKGAKCDGCKCTGRKLEESFIWRGEMKRVCNQHCLLLFYTQQNIPNMNTQTQSTIPAIQFTQVAPKTTTPVITNVVSLAPGQQQQTGHPTNSVQYQPKPVPIVIKKCHKQTQITTAPPKAVRPPLPPTPLPPAPKIMKNKVTLVKPYTQTKSVSCRPLTSTKGTMTDELHPLIIPVPVPIYVPVPMHMYTTPVPHPVTLPVPVPVPIFIPVAYNNADRLLASIKEIREKIPSDPLEAEMLMLADAIAGDDGSKTDQAAKLEGGLEWSSLQTPDEGDEIRSLTMDDAEDVIPSQLLADNILKMAADIAHVLEEDPSSELQDDLNSLQAVEAPKIDVPTRTTRSKSGKTPGRRGRSRGSKRACVEEPLTPEVEETLSQLKRSKEEARNTIGVNAYRYFVSKKKTSQAGKELKSITWNPNLLDVSTEELSYILCLMCKEGTQPDGTKYSPDILHLIFLSIQHHLSDNGRPENIFTDQFYRRFTDLLHDEIKGWMIDRHPVTDIILNTCINEETLWNAKQLGAHSPYILLSTMIYFNAKHFQLKTLESHKALAFCRIQKQIRKMGTARSMFLRYYPADRKKALSELAPKRKRDRDTDVESTRLEQSENTDNPLRCPVRLYEFYLSKCPDSVRGHSELFYLVPERSCVPDSPVWYSSAPLADQDMNKILTRMLMVTDIHETWSEINEDGDY